MTICIERGGGDSLGSCDAVISPLTNDKIHTSQSAILAHVNYVTLTSQYGDTD